MFEDSCILRTTSRPPLSTTIYKTRTTRIALCALGLALFGVPAASVLAQPTPVPVLTWRYDLTHAGQNTNETALTPANVNVNSFGKLFSLSVDSSMYAQPLYVPGLKMSDGLVHNVLFVATENDSIYAFDADSNGGANANPIWKITLLDAAHGAGPGAAPQQPGDTDNEGDIGPTMGITGTPTINPATNTMYVIGVTKESGQFYSRLHAINIINGAEQANSPVDITATTAGTGLGSSGGQLSFSPLWENQRSALNYYNGYVYFGYGAHGDLGNWHGWLFAYDATTLKQTTALCLSPNDHGAGIWESGAGMPIDDDAPGGRMFVATGNGAVSSYPPFQTGESLSMSILDFNLANGGITPTDGFTSYNYETINSGDLDQGSGGVLMVPDQQGSHPHILINAGKEGRILVLDRDKLGGNNVGASSNATALQDISNVIPYEQGLWSTPAYWNGNVYLWAEKNYPMLFKLNTGVMDTTPSSEGKIYSDFPGASFSISSNGTQDGIAWVVRSDQFSTYGPEVLYAWDANDLSAPIYESDTNSTRDGAGQANKFSIPVVTNGKVYIVAYGEVDVYGLFNGTPTTATPVITPDGGTFSAGQSVKLSTATPSATIYYTLDGTTPTTASAQYTDPIAMSTDTTVKAIAGAPGYIQSAVSSAIFTFTGQTPPLTFRPAAGTYLAAQTVTISDPNTKAKIYYTLDGSTPSASSKLYTDPFKVLVSETIKAVAIAPSLQNSNIGTAAYVIQEGGASINFGNGFASTKGLTFNGSAVANNDTRLQLTTGQPWQGGSVWWNAPINVQAFTTNFEFQLTVAQGNGFTFTIQNTGVHALGGDSAGLGYQNIQKSVAVKFDFYNYEGEGDDSTGVYTDGEPPLLPTVNIAPSGIQLDSGNAIDAKITYDGTTLTLTLYDGVIDKTFTMSKVIKIPAIVGGDTAYVGFTGGTGGGISASQKLLSWTYATESVPPVFTPGAGTYKAAQSVTLRSATANAAIYYTTNGTTPTAASARYSRAIAVDATETIKAIAISPTAGSSIIRNAAYVIHAPPSIAMNATPPKAITAGGSTTSIVTITPEYGFKGSVALKCAISAKPEGAIDVPTCTVTRPAAITGTRAVTATLTIKTLAATTRGDYRATMTGTSGTVIGKANAAFTVTGPNFTLRGTPLGIPEPGKSATSTVTITPIDGFRGAVEIKCAITAKPTDAIDPPTCTATQPAAITGTRSVTSMLTIKTAAKTTKGAYAVTVTASSKSVQEEMSEAVRVAMPEFRPTRTPIKPQGASR
ncbi:MAG: chitobiase/beta-hexosaminidase C-terminal domain-containing protein [Terracidiphilus sp.]